MAKISIAIVLAGVVSTIALYSRTIDASAEAPLTDGPVQGGLINMPPPAEPVGESAPLGQVDEGDTVAGIESLDDSERPSGGPPKRLVGPDGLPIEELPTRGTERTEDGALVVTFEELACYWFELPKPDLTDLYYDSDDEEAEGAEDEDSTASAESEEDGADSSDQMNDQIPDSIRSLHGKRVEIAGFMLPIDVAENQKVKTFILSRYPPSCCFGQFPEINEWVDVEVIGEGVDFIHYGSVFATGTFEVGALLDEFGYVRSLYRMKAETVTDQW